MANIGIFDVLGPIMIGPSSSHTAGAARLGKIAGTIVNKPIFFFMDPLGKHIRGMEPIVLLLQEY